MSYSQKQDYLKDGPMCFLDSVPYKDMTDPDPTCCTVYEVTEFIGRKFNFCLDNLSDMKREIKFTDLTWEHEKEG